MKMKNIKKFIKDKFLIKLYLNIIETILIMLAIVNDRKNILLLFKKSWVWALGRFITGIIIMSIFFTFMGFIFIAGFIGYVFYLIKRYFKKRIEKKLNF